MPVLLRLALLAGLLGMIHPLAAVSIDDLRFQYTASAGHDFSAGGTVETSSSTHPPATSANENVDGDASFHVRRSLIYRRSLGELRDSFGSFLWGLELSDDVVQEQQETTSYRGRSEMGDLFLGWAWALPHSWHLEEGILIGMGRSRWAQTIADNYPDGAAWSDESEGFSTEYGIDLAVYYTLDQHWQAGIDLRHMVMDSHTRFIDQHTSTDQVNDPGDVTSSNANWKFTVEGINLSCALGYRF